MELRQDLAKDKSPEVVYALIENPATPEQILSKFTRSFHRDYAVAAREALQKRKRGVQTPAVAADEVSISIVDPR